MAHEVTLIPGDGTGPELCAAARRVIEALGVDVRWDVQELPDRGIPQPMLDAVRRTGVALVGHQHLRGRPQVPIVALRKRLGVFANVRPARTLPGLPTRHPELDLVVIRETTEDIYAHLEHESIPGVFESLKVTTRAACERIARFAFHYARQHGRRKVTIVHKANIMKKSDGLFLRVAREVAGEFPELAYEDVIVDALCMRLVLDPGRFDVLVCGNLYGDIIADLTAGIAGGASNCPSINVGDGVHLFAAPHGDPFDAAGTDRANPLLVLMPTVALLQHLGEAEAADRLQRAVEGTLAEGVLPVAVGGEAGTRAFTQALTARL